MVQKAVANPARLSYQGEALFSITFPLFLVPVSFCFYGSGFVSLSAAPDVIVLP